MSVSFEKIYDLTMKTMTTFSFEFIVLAIVTTVVMSGLVFVIWKRTDQRKMKMILSQVSSLNEPLVIFRKGKLVWFNPQAENVYPQMLKGSDVLEVEWKFSGTLDQQASLFNDHYTVYSLTPVEVAIPVETASAHDTKTKSGKNHFKTFNSDMELFENVLNTNNYLLMAAGITIFADKTNCELEQFPKFEQLIESFVRIGHYLLKDKPSAHIDFLFDSKNEDCYIQMTLKNFRASEINFRDDFFLKGFGNESFQYQLSRLELLFESLGGSMQIVESNRDFIFIAKTPNLGPIVSDNSIAAA